MTLSGPSLEQIKGSLRAVWTAGDFGVIAKTTVVAAEEFAARLSIPRGSHVLDVACGTGNLAIPIARQGAIVTGVDIATNSLAQARERAAAENLAIKFEEGDAEQLPYGDAMFDAAVSIFGAMFAPRPERVAAEFARVLKPGGLLAMANWNPASFSAQMFRVTSRHVAAPEGVAPPPLWGDDAIVRERLAANFENIQTEIIPIDFDFPSDPAGVVTLFRTYFGPTQMAFNRLDESGQAALAADLEALWAAANRATDAASRTLIRNEYLQVTATRKRG